MKRNKKIKLPSELIRIREIELEKARQYKNKKMRCQCIYRLDRKFNS
jgi:hypothetical protein